MHTIDPRRRDEHIRWLASAGIEVNAVMTTSNSVTGRIRICAEDNSTNKKTLALFEEVVRDAKEKGFPLIRFVTQMEWALESELDFNDLLEYEAKVNDVWLRQDGPVNLVICIYDLKRFRGDLVVDVMRTHPLVIIGGVLQENPFFVPPGKVFRPTTRLRPTTRKRRCTNQIGEAKFKTSLDQLSAKVKSQPAA